MALYGSDVSVINGIIDLVDLILSSVGCRRGQWGARSVVNSLQESECSVSLDDMSVNEGVTRLGVFNSVTSSESAGPSRLFRDIPGSCRRMQILLV